MKAYRELVDEQQSIANMYGLLQVYEELSAKKMTSIRDKIINVREFMTNLAELSGKVGADLSQIFSGKKKQAAVLLSANGGLYGNLLSKVFSNFSDFIDDNQVEAVIVGQLGRQMFSRHYPNKDYRYLELSEHGEMEKELKEVVKILSSYVQITVFYGKFKNIARQNPEQKNISGRVFEIMTETATEDGQVKATKFLYEPSPEKISDKFGQNLLTSMFSNFYQEHELAKQASRLMQLDQAMDEISNQKDKLRLSLRKARKKMENKKQTTRSMRVLI